MTLGSLDFLYTPSTDLPPGPAFTFRTPGGLRMAIYQPSRPFVVESFRGRRDFG
jgi:hypothetical protein